MSKSIPNPSKHSPATGYSLVELMVAMGLSLLLLGMTFTMTNQLYNTVDLAGTMGDVNENLRAAVNAVSRDLSTAGAEIPLGGIPIPNGGTATLINRPGPPGSAYTFPPIGTIPVVTPGGSKGPTQGTATTDIITVISVNPLSQLDQNPLTAISYSVTAGSITVNTATCGWGAVASACPAGFTAANSQVTPGQLIMLANSKGYCLLTATAVNLTTGVITFTHGDVNDTLGVNQFTGPTSGMIKQLQTSVGPPAVWPSTTAYHLSMITYYLDTSSPRKLMRIVTGQPNQPQTMALGINILLFSYSLSPAASPTDPNDYATSDSSTPPPWTNYVPNQIRKVNLSIIATADHANRGSKKVYTKEIDLPVTVQNLAYYNRY